MLQQKSFFFSVMYSCCCLTGLGLGLGLMHLVLVLILQFWSWSWFDLTFGLGLNILVLFPSLSLTTVLDCCLSCLVCDCREDSRNVCQHHLISSHLSKITTLRLHSSPAKNRQFNFSSIHCL